MSTLTVATFNNTNDAAKAIDELEASGVQNSEISYIGPSTEQETIIQSKDGESVMKGMGSGAVTGAVIGGLAGLIVAAGILPGLGALFVAGPLATALGLTGAAATTAGGALTGAAAGGLIGALSNLGISEADAKYYAERIRSGDILVTIKSANEKIKDILRENNANEIKQYAN